MTIITRFAPSPTGFLHIGGARTALFNYLFARRHNGKFLLRIEDTDQQRSTREAITAIIEGLKWLGIDHDGEIVYQSARAERHRQIAMQLVEIGAAYHCFTSRGEIEEAKTKAISAGRSFLFHSPWRDVAPKDYPHDKPSVIRLKTPTSGEVVFQDQVQGLMRMESKHLDDLVLLRSDGSPTYMLSVVVDDHDMNITHIIRGDDHLSNTFKQVIIYQALAWNVPVLAHIPLIHGPDGAKLSKRHGALGVDAYRQMGYLSEALNNYLLRLGWSHGDDEIISRKEAIAWFNLENIGKSPARLDFNKMNSVNAHYLRNSDDQVLRDLVAGQLSIAPEDKTAAGQVMQAISALKKRANSINELANDVKLYLHIMPQYSTEIREQILQIDKQLLAEVQALIERLASMDRDYINEQFSLLAQSKGLSLNQIMRPLRMILTGRDKSPSLFELISIIGKDETLHRIAFATSN